MPRDGTPPRAVPGTHPDSGVRPRPPAVPPLWQRLAGRPTRGATNIHERRHGLLRLAAFVLLWLQAELGAGREDPEDPDTQSVSGDEDAWREPGHELAEVLGLPESALNRLCRERTGFTAREWWDLLRAPGLVETLKEDARAWLDGESFARPSDSCPPRPETPRILYALQRRRRLAGWSKQQRAWQLGFRNAARLDRALFAMTGRTAATLEAEVAAEAQAGWYYVPQDRSLRRAEPCADERTRDARGATFLRVHRNDGRPGLWFPNPDPNHGYNDQFLFEPLADWPAVLAHCEQRRLSLPVVVVHNGRRNIGVERGHDLGRDAARWLGYDSAEIDRAAAALEPDREAERTHEFLRAVFDRNYEDKD
ncbi:MAG: hypothetical protein M5U26_06710 [Planctomycetota bacterium]|nr:hypothetical protein [Planctomycetota bacterium]